VRDPVDLHILDALQGDIPLVDRPYAVIASQVGIPEHELLERLTKLKEAGVLRGISPVLESRQMGLSAATLVALHVPEDNIRKVADIVSSCPEVSHNFRRDHYYTLWFTISAENDERVGQVLAGILDRAGVPAGDHLNLPTVKKLKIDVRFPFLPSHGKEV
jgi:DNA-binding Lrp family transcriptional regulator